MSLDVYLKVTQPCEIYSANITHNLGKMADACGLYIPMWRPEEAGITKASQLIAPLTEGLRDLKSNKEKYESLAPSNGWGSYDGLVKFVEGYLAACVEYPDAEICVSR